MSSVTMASTQDVFENGQIEKVHLDLHKTVKEMQLQHGIVPHQDYDQYRQYCTRKLGRLRRNTEMVKSCGRTMLHGSGGRGKSASVFQPRKYVSHTQSLQKGNGNKWSAKDGHISSKDSNKDQEEDLSEEDFGDVNHQNYLLILLTHSERCWSAAMHVKTQYDSFVSPLAGFANNTNGRRGKTTHGKLRKHFLSKLCKAAHYASTLHSMAHYSADETTAFECHAYTSWMAGNFALETSQWEIATREYGTCLNIVNSLSRSSAGDLEMVDYFTSRGEYTIQPLLKYCRYELVQSGRAAPDVKMQDILSSGSFDKRIASVPLTSKLNEKTKETRRAQVSQMDSKYSKVTYRDVSLQVENEGLQVLLCKLDEMKNGEEGTEKEKGLGFTLLLSTYDDAITVVTKDMHALEQLASGKQVNASRHVQACLKGYFQYQKLSALMKRNERIAQDMESNEKLGGKTKRVEDLAHLYSVLLQNAKEITLLPLVGCNFDPNHVNDASDVEDEFGLEAMAHVLRFRALKSFYAAQVHAQIGKNEEALVLLEHSAKLAGQAREELVACELSVYSDALSTLQENVSAGTCTFKANAYLSVHAMSGRKVEKKVSLRLYEFDAGKCSDGIEHIIQVPPPLAGVSCKPAFFDIAQNVVTETPNLQLVLDAHQKKSAGILGWFRN